LTKRGVAGREPLLYPLVYVASLALVTLSSGALALLGHEHVIDAAVEVQVTDDQAVVRQFVAANLDVGDLSGGILADNRRAVIEPVLADLVHQHGYRDIAIVDPASGRVLAQASETGTAVSVVQTTAGGGATGQTRAEITPAGARPGQPAILVEAVPLVEGGAVRAVFQISRGAAPILARADEAFRDVVIVTTSAAMVLALLLYSIFRAANQRLVRQELELGEARRRDPLTGLLNHSAAVAALTDLVEQARRDSGSLGVAIIDIDNFRLLNDVHGSRAGDEALLTVAQAFRPAEEQWDLVARFGPDEFLVIAPGEVARDLPAASRRLRERLTGGQLDLPGSEPLPVTVSIGIAYFPFHAGSVTELVSVVARALGEAKESGGNEIAIAGAWSSDAEAPYSSFDVLQGLVLAVDRKDRYTKLHSEDVATYSLYLAARVGVPEEMRANLRIGALLHDVGKIGIPDDILRKPGRLTAREYDILKQHVALGDLLVGSMPDVQHIREAVRYHHERWDGQGYLAGLAGEGIPLIARILAVVDAYSAMTTSRPYRKAMPIERALAELRSVAGTQLDADLVDAFVTGMESDPEAPLLGATGLAATTSKPAPQAA
jgi:diguanylate cyclase (GGDEF)-like protein